MSAFTGAIVGGPVRTVIGGHATVSIACGIMRLSHIA